MSFVVAQFRELLFFFQFLSESSIFNGFKIQDSSEVSLDFPGILCFQRFIVSRINSN